MQNEIKAAESLLKGSGISVLDAARLIRNALDYAGNGYKDNLQYCREVIECGMRHIGKISRKMTINTAFSEYLEAKKSLRKESLRDIKYIGNRILKHFDKSRLISEISTVECSKLLEETFTTPSQQNKGRTMLHGLFNYAVKMKWCAENPISEIPPKKVVEREILPLSIEQIQRLLKCTLSERHCDCAAAVGIMLWAGIRPKEVSRLTWRDIDLEEHVIVVRRRNSKTGGVRHIDICPPLRHWLGKIKKRNGQICPKNWIRKWHRLRVVAGFKHWTQDVLRHTFATYHLKRFHNLPKLQSEMGHADLSLIRTRYVNMGNITKADAKCFFEPRGILEYGIECNSVQCVSV